MSRPPRSPPLRVRVDGNDHLLVPPLLSSRVNTSTTSIPGFVFPVALQTDYVPSRHMLPELERLINAFTPPLSPLSTRRPRIAYGSSIVHDANDPASACGIDGLLKFSILPLAHTTPTRTSLASFEPLLPLLTRRCLLLFILLFHDPAIAPRRSWQVPETCRTVVFGWWFVGYVELMG